MSFTPVVRNANSVVKALIEFSKDRKMDVKSLDFELLSFETLLKNENDTEYKIITNKDEISQESFLNPTTIIIQEYSIRIMPKEPKVPKVKITLGVNKLKTKAIATLHKGTLLNKDITSENIKDLIWHKKLLSGLFIGIFEKNLDAQIKKLLQVVPKEKALLKDLKFSVAQGIEPVLPIDAKIEKLYEKTHSNSDSLIDSIDKGDKVLLYTKEQLGKDGRACNGRYLKMRTPKTENLQPIHDESIINKENSQVIEYFANDDGYIVHEGSNICISKTLKLEGADFKSTAHIDGGDSSKDISVHIKHKKSHAEDAVSSGVNIDVKELNIDGSVGSNVKITTQELNIDAQTHKQSKIEVENSANVKLHRGDMIAKDATIEILESGTITAHNSIHIKKMLGGEAIAPIVKIDELLSNATIIASKLIEIKLINGENSTLKIDPKSIKSYHKNLSTLQEEQKVQIHTLKIMQEEIQEKMKEHSQRVDRIKVFQQRVLKNQKAGKAPMKQDIIRIREFKKDALRLQEEQKKVVNFETKLKTTTEELDKLYNKDLHAKIISHSPHNGHNKIIFVNMKTEEEIIHLADGDIETISLVLNEKGERVLHFQ